MSANPDILRTSELIGSADESTSHSQAASVREANGWDPEVFAREQIWSLVRRVFFSREGSAVRHVVFCAAGSNADVGNICLRVGRALASETPADVAVVLRENNDTHLSLHGDSRTIKSHAARLGTNLWRVADFGLYEGREKSGSGQYWIPRLAELRSEFDFVVIHGPAAGISSEAELIAELVDGMVLVLEANITRRASARRLKEILESGRCRILGTVLNQRAFPIPQRIYQRL